MISGKEALKIAEKLESSDIDIQKTIEKATSAGYLGENHFYCSVIEEGGITYSVPEILGDRYRSIELDNLYYDVLSKALDREGIYISLAYCNTNLKIPDCECSEILEYDEYELEEDELDYLEQYTLITADDIKKFNIYAEEGISGHGGAEDIGIIINIIDGNYKSYFAIRIADICMATLQVIPLSFKYPKEDKLSLKNPINRILVEMINNTIVFK